MAKSQEAQTNALIQLQQFSLCLDQNLKKFFSPYQLTAAQFNILTILKNKGGKALAQKELVNKLNVSRANITIILDRMERDGYIKRTDSKTDKRIKTIQITYTGKKKILQAEKTYPDFIKHIFQGTSLSDLKSLQQIIQKLKITQ